MFQTELFHFESDVHFHQVFPRKIRNFLLTNTQKKKFELVNDDILRLNVLVVLEEQLHNVLLLPNELEIRLRKKSYETYCSSLLK
jgi:hypothetical protein